MRLTERDILNNVLVLDLAVLLAQYRSGIRIPLEDYIPPVDLLSVGDQEVGTVGDF